jgi:hypothetical protein
MYLWMPMVAWGLVKLFCALIDWWARVSYERTRAASVVDVLRAVPAGVSVRDSRADGTVLCVDPLVRKELDSRSTHEKAGKRPC